MATMAKTMAESPAKAPALMPGTPLTGYHGRNGLEYQVTKDHNPVI
jgi:hypothetical protein